MKHRTKQPKRRQRSAAPRPFGGRATSGGVGYEVQIAACLAVKMLYGERALVWDGVHGTNLAALTLQTPDAVDDIVGEVTGLDSLTAMHISAKDRSGSIALTTRSPAFAETVAACVRQFRNLLPSVRTKVRLIWAVPSSAGHKVTRDLLTVLDSFRLNQGSMLAHFIRGRMSREREALNALLGVIRKAWRQQAGKLPTETELKQVLMTLHVQVYDFAAGAAHDRLAQQEIRSHIAENPADAAAIWRDVMHHFTQANQRGVRTTAASLRRLLIGQGHKLQSPPDYAADIATLRAVTAVNQARLAEHAALRFGVQPVDAVHLDRSAELGALATAARKGHLLVTGEPGGGKSGLLHDLVGELKQAGIPVVLLLAEEVFTSSAAGLTTLKHKLDEVLAQWPEGAPGVLVTDALDAVRDMEVQQQLRALIRTVQQGSSGWTVVASVREFDLKFGRELREAFPGRGVEGYAAADFHGVAHFHVPRLSEAQLDALARHRPEIGPFLQQARANSRAGGLHRSPFYLRLTAALLKDGVNPQHLGDWSSPALLMRKFWDGRINEGPGADDRRAALAAICRQMVTQRRMAVSEKELPLEPRGRAAVRELQSRGILQSPRVLHGMPANIDEIKFNHHLLHDYAIARALIPATADAYCDLTVKEPLLTILYRQSFLFAVEELWDADAAHAGFWTAALRLEGEAGLHGITRIIAPVLAARRVMTPQDLNPLLAAIERASDSNAPASKALAHLASGLQDADTELIRAGAIGWCDFASRLSTQLTRLPFLETPLVHMLARLTAAHITSDEPRRALNAAARALLAHHVGKPVEHGWGYAARVAVEAVCRTFDTAVAESEAALLALLVPVRLAKFPHTDLRELACNLKHLEPEGDEVVRRLFEAAFAAEPERNQWEERGTLIMGMRFQTSDEWNSIHYQLAEYYEIRSANNPALMTEAACVVWNAVVRRRSSSGPRQVLATVGFRGRNCDLVADAGHIWRRQHEPEESRILACFETRLREWVAAPAPTALGEALDRFAERNRTSTLWQILLEVGAEFPDGLGRQLIDLLDEPVFLTESDYAYGGTRLLGALHKAGDTVTRERLEKLILNLPRVVRLRRGERRQSPPAWVQHAQNRLLGSLEAANIVLPEVTALWQARQAAQALVENRRSAGFESESRTLTDRESVEMNGVDLKQPANAELFRLRQELQGLGEREGKFDMQGVSHKWALLLECDRAVKQYRQSAPQMAADVWCRLAGFGQQIAHHAKWPRSSPRWAFIRDILLRAADDPEPKGKDKPKEDAEEDGKFLSYTMQPRIHAALGLPMLARRLDRADSKVSATLRRLSADRNQAVRFNLARRAAALETVAPKLMWALFDRLSTKEQSFPVLAETAAALNRLWARHPKAVLAGLQVIAKKARGASPENSVHEVLAHVHLYEYLRRGRPECEAYLTGLIERCDTAEAFAGLGPLLHACRAGHWLTAGDAVTRDARRDQYRARAWQLFGRILAKGQAKLAGQRAELDRLHKAGRIEGPKAKAIREAVRRTMELVDGVGMQLFFASGAHADKVNKGDDHLPPPQLERFWQEAVPLFRSLASEPHPHTAYHLVQTLQHLLPCAPREVFLLAAQSIRSSIEARFQYDQLAAKVVVSLVQQALADHRDIFRAVGAHPSDCLTALLEVLDFFVEAGWSDARLLVNRLEEIYR